VADALYQQGHIDKATLHYEQLLRQAPHDVGAVLGLARCRHDSAQLNDACKLLDALLTEEPDQCAALLERGRLALRLNDPAAAESWLRRACDVAPLDSEANLVLQHCLDVQGRPDEAVRERGRQSERLQAKLRLRLREHP